jgi:hypothetical protein
MQLGSRLPLDASRFPTLLQGMGRARNGVVKWDRHTWIAKSVDVLQVNASEIATARDRAPLLEL